MDEIFDLKTDLLSKDFDLLCNSRDRIDYIFGKLGSVEDLRTKFAEFVSNLKNKNNKSSEKSKSYRQKGNLYFNRKIFEYALYYYNLSVLYAPYPSESGPDIDNDLAYAYTSRSLALSELKAYENALFDINCALNISEFSMKFDEKLQLMIHKVNCLRQLKRYETAIVVTTAIIQLIPCLPIFNDVVKRILHMRDEIQELQEKYKDSEDMDCTSESQDSEIRDDKTGNDLDLIEEYLNDIDTYLSPDLKLCQNGEKGRHFVAVKDIPKGKVIGVEKSIAGVIFKDFHLTHCQNCFRNIGYKWWPCRQCRNVVFCSEECLKSANYHSRECGFIDAIQSIGPSHHILYRIIQLVGPQDIITLWKRNKMSTEDMDSNEAIYRKFSDLIDHKDQYERKTRVISICKSIQMALLLNTFQDFKSFFDTIDNLKDFVVVLDESNLKVMTNAFGVYEFRNNGRAFRGGHIGNAIALDSSFFNHSCSPNTNWIFNGSHVTFATNQEIKSGEEVTISYGPLSNRMAFKERQHLLKKRYFFECKCGECVKQSISSNT